MGDHGEREALALMLHTQAEAVSEVLRRTDQGRLLPTLAALAATRTLDQLIDDILRTLVRQARREGRTWQEIGDVMHTTRQAAYQRFGRDLSEVKGEGMAKNEPVPDATRKARELLGLYAERRWAEIRRDFNDTMQERLSEEMLSGGWTQIEGMVGDLVSLGDATVRVVDSHTVVDVPMRFARGEMTGRVAYDATGRIAGLFILRPEVA